LILEDNKMKNLKITVNGTAYDVQVEEVSGTAAPAVVAAQPVAPVAPAPVAAPVEAPKAAEPAPKAAPSAAPSGEVITAPMPGTIVGVNVELGKSVKKGEALVILEAMKMENEIMAPHDAVVIGVHVNKGDSVNSGTPLVSLQ
jgi:glutaconyl-CoA decarboxylase